MSLHILSSLAVELNEAYQVVETFVLSAKSNRDYIVEVGKSLLSGTHRYRATIILQSAPGQPVGVCHGDNSEQVTSMAQQIISRHLTECTADSQAMQETHSGV